MASVPFPKYSIPPQPLKEGEAQGGVVTNVLAFVVEKTSTAHLHSQ
jgi:hypothetical protein